MDEEKVQEGALLCLGCATPLPTGAHACPTCLRPQDWMANTLAPYAQWSQGYLIGSAAMDGRPQRGTVFGLAVIALFHAQDILFMLVAAWRPRWDLAGPFDSVWAWLGALLIAWAPAVLFAALAGAAFVRSRRSAEATGGPGPARWLLAAGLLLPTVHFALLGAGVLPGSARVHVLIALAGFAATVGVLTAFLVRNRPNRTWIPPGPDLEAF
ncbi:MAG: hypothetical protein KDB73_17690 [Planctomycetes bacterium]|nr:hypothetical protein [Planctomycetota bacterium]